MSAVSPLHDFESAAGACFETLFGSEIAAHYRDPHAEYEALRWGAGAMDLCDIGKLSVSGRDRVRYLHNMLTNDIRKLGSGEGCHAALLTRQGMMEAELWVYAFANELWLECPPCAAGRVFDTLKKHIVGDDVQLENMADDLGVVSLQGPKAGAAMERVLGVSLSGLRPFDHRLLDGKTAPWVVVARDRTGLGGYDLWLPRTDIAGVWRRWSETEEIRPVGFRALNLIRSEAGIPWYGWDMDDRTLPMEMGLESAISLNKGCYRGQEIVARITYRAHLDRRLGGIVLEGGEPPPKGAEVRFEGGRIGVVTSAVMSPRLAKPLALAVMKTAFLKPGMPLEVVRGDEVRSGRTVALPLP